MHHLKSKKILFQKSIFVVFLILTYDTAFAEETIFFDELYQSPAQELDLSVDLNKVYKNSERPNFSGYWVIEPSESDDPNEILKELKKGKKEFSSRRNSGDSGKGTRGSRGMGRGSKNNERSTINSDGRNNVLSELKKILVNEMEVIHQEPLLKIYSKQNGEQTVYTDFRSSSISAMGGVNQQITVSGWEGNSLIIETTRPEGPKSIQTLNLLTNPQRLEQITELSAQNQDMKPVQIRQIYILKKQTNQRNSKPPSYSKF